MPDDPVPLVLTALFDDDTQDRLERLRRAYFPPERNVVPAHLTLFHALPGPELDAIQTALSQECTVTDQSATTLLSWRFTGRGVAREVHSPDLGSLRARLAARWRNWLTPQDRQPWRPHVTIQNKVRPEVARALHQVLSTGAGSEHAMITGLLLWRYRGGPWDSVAGFSFR